MAKSFNPFAAFRKNQKVALALITLLSMFAFVCVGPSLMGGNSRGSGAGKIPVVAKWNYGDITQTEVSRQLASRHRINVFIEEVCGRAAALKKIDEDAQFPVFQPENTQDMLISMVLAKKAELMGMTVTDTAVNDYIDAITNRALSQQDKDAALAKAMGDRGGSAMTADQFFDAFRFELLARNFRTLAMSDSIDYATPEERWDFYSRLNREATVEVLPVAVKDFVDKVPDPPSAELQSLFDKYKDRLPEPALPEPGFMVPAKAKFQYFKAVRATLAKADEAKITNKEIDEYYGQHKENFRKSTFPADVDSSSDKAKPAETKPGNSTKTPDSPKSGDKAKPADAPAHVETKTPGTDAKTDVPPKPSAAPSTDAAPTADRGAKPATTPPSDAPKTGTPKTDTPKTDTDTSTPPAKPDDKPKSADEKKSSDSRPVIHPRGSEELLAIADDATPPASAPTSDKKPDDAKKSDDKTTPPATSTPPAKLDATKADATKPDAAKSDATKPDAPKPDAAKTDAPKTDPAKTDAGKVAPPKTDPAKSGATTAPADDFDPVTDPKVRSQIRSTLATQKAQTEISDAFKSLHSIVQNYSRAHAEWVGNGSVANDEPDAPDFAKLAKSYGMTYEQTGVLNALQIQDQELGKSVSLQEQPFTLVHFASPGYDPNLPLYTPQPESMSPDAEESYLWWRSEYDAAYVPTYIDAKPDVLHAYKMIEARKLALDEGKKYADDANKRNAKLKEIFQNRPNMTVSEVGPFHWLTLGNVPMGNSMQQMPRLTQVSGVDLAGVDFMRAVFTTDPGKTAVVFNQPKTIAYVVQVETISPPEDAFRQSFQRYQIDSANNQNWGQAGLAAQLTSRGTQEEKLHAIEDELGFQMVAAPAGQGAAQSGGGPSGPADGDDD